MDSRLQQDAVSLCSGRSLCGRMPAEIGSQYWQGLTWLLLLLPKGIDWLCCKSGILRRLQPLPQSLLQLSLSLLLLMRRGLPRR